MPLVLFDVPDAVAVPNRGALVLVGDPVVVDDIAHGGFAYHLARLDIGRHA